jgi:DDE superfamily endonuclease
MSLSGMGESMCVRGATDSEVFEIYVEHFLARTLSEGQVVVLDNLGAHRPKRIRELIEERGAELVFLPSYSSPDLKWDEKTEIMLRAEPTMTSVVEDRRSKADPQEGGPRPCPSTTTLPLAST